jgi:hypothetical protein
MLSSVVLHVFTAFKEKGSGQITTFKQIALYFPLMEQQFSVIGFCQCVGAFHFTFRLVPVLWEYGKPG